jgi:hypothetical protein
MVTNSFKNKCFIQQVNIYSTATNFLFSTCSPNSHVLPIATHLFRIFCPNFCPLNYMAWPKERLRNFLHFRRVCSVSIFKIRANQRGTSHTKKRENQIEGPPLRTCLPRKPMNPTDNQTPDSPFLSLTVSRRWSQALDSAPSPFLSICAEDNVLLHSSSTAL